MDRQDNQQKKDGSLVEVQSNIFPIKNAAGKVVNYVAILEDLSLRAVLEEQLRQAQRMETVGRLAGGGQLAGGRTTTAWSGTRWPGPLSKWARR